MNDAADKLMRLAGVGVLIQLFYTYFGFLLFALALAHLLNNIPSTNAIMASMMKSTVTTSFTVFSLCWRQR